MWIDNDWRHDRTWTRLHSKWMRKRITSREFDEDESDFLRRKKDKISVSTTANYWCRSAPRTSLNKGTSPSAPGGHPAKKGQRERVRNHAPQHGTPSAWPRRSSLPLENVRHIADFRGNKTFISCRAIRSGHFNDDSQGGRGLNLTIICPSLWTGQLWREYDDVRRVFVGMIIIWKRMHTTVNLPWMVWLVFKSPVHFEREAYDKVSVIFYDEDEKIDPWIS